MTEEVKAIEILRHLENDVDLIPFHMADWWLNYLKESSEGRYLDILSFFTESDKEKRILDIGCIPGHFTVLLKKLGYNVCGVDIDATRLEKFWKKYDISTETVNIEQEPLPYKSNEIDIVLFTAILEHLHINPLFALREVYRVLKSKGQLILGTPNITLQHRIAFLFGRSYQGDIVEELKRVESIGHMGHFRLYSSKEVKNMLEYVGFDISSCSYKGRIPGEWKTQIMLMLYPKKKYLRHSLYVIARK